MIIDIVVGAIVLISAIISFLRGFIREVLTIAGVVGGLFAAIFFGPSLSPTFQSWLGIVDGEEIERLFDIVPMNIVADICAYATIFIVVVIVISIISHFTAGAIKLMGLGPIDRTLGVIFGIFRAVVLLGLIYLPFHLLMDEGDKTKYFTGSKTHLFIEKTAEVLYRFIPSTDDLQGKAKEVTEGALKKSLSENGILQDKSKKTDLNSIPKSEDAGYEKDERQELDDLMKVPTLNE